METTNNWKTSPPVSSSSSLDSSPINLSYTDQARTKKNITRQNHSWVLGHFVQEKCVCFVKSAGEHFSQDGCASYTQVLRQNALNETAVAVIFAFQSAKVLCVLVRTARGCHLMAKRAPTVSFFVNLNELRNVMAILSCVLHNSSK